MKGSLRGRRAIARLTMIPAVAALLMGLVAVTPAAAVGADVLILDTTVTGGASSLEATQAALLGLSVDVVNPVQWAAMTTAQFASYKAIVLGDPTCEEAPAPALTAAELNRTVWSPAVTGNVIVNGTDPVYHAPFQAGAVTLINRSINFAAAEPGKTGLYLSLSCYYHAAPANTPVPVLDQFGPFEVVGQGGCPAISHIVASHPALAGLTDADLSNWSCSTHEGFMPNSIPVTFEVLAISTDIPSTYVAPDGTTGAPYIVARGVQVISDIKLAPETATNPVGTPHCLTATVTQNGAPVVGTTVTFTVVAGPHTGVTGTGVTNSSGEATFCYTGVAAGTDTIQATFIDSTQHTQRSNRVEKTWEQAADPAITASPVPIAATEGTLFNGPVATFTDPDLAATAAEYSATIDWGDTTSSAGTVSGGAGNFTVSGSHVYAEEGPFAVTVVITDVDNAANTATVTSPATVADAPLASRCAMAPFTGQVFAGPTATFTDASSTGTLSDFSATINWGDTTSSAGTIVGGPGLAPYTVSGTHTYTSTGPFTVTTTVNDVGGSSTVATCGSTVFAFAPGGGSFVIGDTKSATGTSVMFWGAQWWKANPVSSGTTVPAFKGFALKFREPDLRRHLEHRPGQQRAPPAGPLPAYMGVIVTSRYSKSGSAISGDILRIVIVRTDPGYDPNPGPFRRDGHRG